MGHVDRVDKNVSLASIALKRCKCRYHRQLFLWLISAVAFNNVLILFMMVCPLVEVMQQQHESSGFGWKHWFQHQLASVLINRGIQMAQRQRRQKAAKVFGALFRSGQWTAKWRDFHKNHCTCCDHTSPAVEAPPAVSRRGRGRPRKKKRGSGGGLNKLRRRLIPATPSVNTTRKRARMQDRLNTFEFQSPAPFQPRKVGRKTKKGDGDTVYVGGKAHSLVRGSTLGLWKSIQGECVCCYARAPPAPAGSRKKKFMADGTRIPRPCFACDVCERWLCKDCHHNAWPPHLGGTKPLGMIYSKL